MMRTVWRALVCLCLGACGTPAPAGPSAAILAMRDQFEADVLTIEKDYPNDAEGLHRAAMAIALKVYSADWRVVRAEAKRSLAALPEIDLSAYETAAPVASDFDPAALQETPPFTTPAGLATMRFWDANTVGFTIAPMWVNLMRDGASAAMIGMKMSLAPNRVWRGSFGGEDVLASRFMRSMVIIPYTFTAEGMIRPEMNKVRAYDLSLVARAQ